MLQCSVARICSVSAPPGSRPPGGISVDMFLPPFLVGKGPTAPLQEVALGCVLGAGDRRLVRQPRFGVAAEAPEQVGADGVEQVVARQVEAIDHGERGVRSLDLGYRDRTVEPDDRARSKRQELVVQPYDLPPVRGGCVWGIA